MNTFVTDVAAGVTASALFSPVLIVLEKALEYKINSAFQKSTSFSTLHSSLTSRLCVLSDVLNSLPPSTQVTKGALDNLSGAVTESHDLLKAFEGGPSILSALRKKLGHLARFERVHARLDSAIGDLHLSSAVMSSLSWDPEKLNSAMSDLQKELSGLDLKLDMNNKRLLAMEARLEALSAQGRASIPASLKPIGRSEVVRGDVIGVGGFGAVYLAKWSGTVAAEKTLTRGQTDAKGRKAFLDEATVMAKNRHPNVVALYGIVDDPEDPSLIMEYVPGGSLFELLHGSEDGGDSSHGGVGALSPVAAARIGLEIAKGLAYVHGEGIVHRDVKSANVLISSNWEGVKVTDFGLSRAKSSASLLKTRVGTDAWMAPEVHSQRGHDFSADVYSWAVVMSELLTGKIPFDRVPNVATIVQLAHQRPSLPAEDGVNREVPGLIGLIHRSWDREPSRRPSMSGIVDELSEMLGEKRLSAPIGSLVSRAQYSAWCQDSVFASGAGLDGENSDDGVNGGSSSPDSGSRVGSAVSSPSTPAVDVGDGEEVLAEGWIDALVSASGGAWTIEETRSRLGEGGKLGEYLRLIPLASMARQVAEAQRAAEMRATMGGSPAPASLDLSASEGVDDGEQKRDFEEWLAAHPGLDPVDGIGQSVVDGLPASILAVIEDKPSVLSALVRIGGWSKETLKTSRDGRGFNALDAAMHLDRVSCVRYLVSEMGMDASEVVERDGGGRQSALDIGAASGSMKAVRMVILYHAARNESLEAGQLLASDSMIGWAARGGHTQVVTQLQRERGEFKEMSVIDGWSLLSLAALSGKEEAVKEFGEWLRTELEVRGALSAAGEDGWSGLHAAVFSEKMSVVKAVVGVIGSVCGKKAGMRVVKDLLKLGGLREVILEQGDESGGGGDDGEKGGVSMFWKEARVLLGTDRGIRACLGAASSSTGGGLSSSKSSQVSSPTMTAV